MHHSGSPLPRIFETEPRIPRRKWIAAFTALFLIAGTAAVGYWTSLATGSATVTTGSDEAFDITTEAATGGALTPGGPTQTVQFTVSNPGSGVQYLAEVIAEVATPTGAPWTAVPGCSAADYAVDTPIITAGEIAPGDAVVGTVAVAMVDTGVNQNACKGASVPLYITAR